MPLDYYSQSNEPNMGSMECHDCSNRVTCEDERPEFGYLYLCDRCADRREEARVHEEAENQIIDEEETPLGI